MENPILLTPEFADYELLDSGRFEKLERFANIVTVRPEPQALWEKSLPESEWLERADAVFRRTNRPEGGTQVKGRRGREEYRPTVADERGGWELKTGTAPQWNIHYSYKGMSMTMRLGFTAFKHVGIFPEQAENWNFIYNAIRNMPPEAEKPSVLNLFAYTGGATLAAAAAGASVTHVDSVKQVVGWARENAASSNIGGIRWIVDDALKFAAREIRRGNRYNGIILDPPAYGRGPDGEKWVLEENITELLGYCAGLLHSENSFFVINLYSMGLSSLLARSTVDDIFRRRCGYDPAGQSGELYFTDCGGRSLPLGVYYRFTR
ncbi:MAG: class I SAM-dependent methyltransferase [Rikenellaceae bacterium]|nr:class I SAM-dependent methyltransferase [Rikenellaceae bacterium]